MRCDNRGLICAAFGTGLLVASCFPYSIVVIVIAALLVVMGVALCRV